MQCEMDDFKNNPKNIEQKGVGVKIGNTLMLLGQQENRQKRRDEFIKRHLTTSLCPLMQVFIN